MLAFSLNTPGVPWLLNFGFMFSGSIAEPAQGNSGAAVQTTNESGILWANTVQLTFHHTTRPPHVSHLHLTGGIWTGAHPACCGKPRRVFSQLKGTWEERVLSIRVGLSGRVLSGCSSSLSINTSGQMRCFCQSWKMHGIPAESSLSEWGCWEMFNT